MQDSKTQSECTPERRGLSRTVPTPHGAVMQRGVLRAYGHGDSGISNALFADESCMPNSNDKRGRVDRLRPALCSDCRIALLHAQPLDLHDEADPSGMSRGRSKIPRGSHRIEVQTPLRTVSGKSRPWYFL
jgi:hypothetical protein